VAVLAQHVLVPALHAVPLLLLATHAFQEVTSYPVIPVLNVKVLDIVQLVPLLLFALPVRHFICFLLIPVQLLPCALAILKQMVPVVLATLDIGITVVLAQHVPVLVRHAQAQLPALHALPVMFFHPLTLVPQTLIVKNFQAVLVFFVSLDISL